jgi:hypothetical protein
MSWVNSSSEACGQEMNHLAQFLPELYREFE